MQAPTPEPDGGIAAGAVIRRPGAARLRAALAWLPAAAAAIALAVVVWQAAPSSAPPASARIARAADGAEPLPAQAGAPALIDLNRASREELAVLPGIGEVLAGRIIASRREAAFQSTDDLVRRGLIKPGLFAEIEGWIGVEPAAPP